MKMYNDLKTKQDKQKTKSTIINWISFFIIIAIGGALGGSIADGFVNQLFNRENTIDLQSVNEYDWNTYNINDLLIESPFFLNSYDLNFLEGMDSFMVEHEHLEFEKSDFIFQITSITYDIVGELDLYGAYTGQIEGIKSEKEIEEFQSKKREINIDGRKGLYTEYSFNINNKDFEDRGIILVDGKKGWFIHLMYPRGVNNSEEIKNEIFNSVRFYD